ncbi:MAG: cupin-like domain-containing protein [Pseudomonadota bacterium]
MQTIREWHNVDQATFVSEILPTHQPAILRGLLSEWPVVRAGLQSAAQLVDYLKQLDTGGTVKAYVGPPEIDGRFFYTDDYRGFNFDARDVSISVALDTLVSMVDDDTPLAIALQAIDMPAVMPSFMADNPMHLLDGQVAPRVWINNRTMIAAHFDVDHNIACVVGGKRHFTLFPPEQAANLYVGPLLNTPGGPPISTVNLRQPDYDRFPRFAEALESAQEAILEPGDAIYIPILWWHGVDSMTSLNVLVNYWWNNAASAQHDPMLSLVHCMAIMSGMPESQRDGWRALFDCFVFQQAGRPGEHLPAELRDVMGELSASDRDMLIAHLTRKMAEQLT